MSLIFTKDRLRRHGLYYCSKLIENNDSPKILINSFWRSGSTFLLELLSEVFLLRPYFEPLTPREKRFQFLYNDLKHDFDVERMNVSVSDVDIEKFVQLMNSCKFDSKWVYRCQTTRNFTANNGKILKLVNGAHCLNLVDDNKTLIIQLERDVFQVVLSFVNSRWTNKFFKNLNLGYLLKSDSTTVRLFYKRHLDFLKIHEWSMIEGVAIYHTLISKFVREHNSEVMYINYDEIINEPDTIINQISMNTGLNYNKEIIEKYLHKPSLTTVKNLNKRKLTNSEIQSIKNIVQKIELL